MFTPATYYSKASKIDFNPLPEALQKGHEYIGKVTNHGADWANYEASSTIKKVIDTYFLKLAEYSNDTAKAEKKTSVKKSRQQTDREVMDEALRKQGVHPEQKGSAKPKTEAPQPEMVSRIPEEIRFIRRFVALNGKTKTKEELLRFINSLQKAIVEKRIRKTSQWAAQVKMIQKKLINTYNGMAAQIKIELKAETYDALKQFANSEKVLASVGFIKRYISMNEKPGMKEKARALLAQINRAYEAGKIAGNDPYTAELQEIRTNLESFISDKDMKVLRVETAALNGLNGILGCACNSLNGFEGGKPAIMNSMDFAEMQFNTIGLQGKWFDLIGDPSGNFSAMVFGKPKMGKSYLCIDFAGYLARHHGSVLYVAKEEGLDLTLQQKLNDKAVKHPNLYVASILPTNLSAYNFIFLDSVNKLGLSPEDLTKLKSANPTKSFIFIFQSTKEGNFRGANSFQHDVDVVIEVPEQGRAVQFGRFNQGGEMNIFNS